MTYQDKTDEFTVSVAYDAQVEYIGSEGTSFIVCSGFNLTSDDVVTTRIKYYGTSGNTYGCFSGSSATDNFCLYSGTYSTSNNSYIRFDGESVRAFRPRNGTTYNIEHSQDGFVANGTTYATFAPSTFVCSSELHVFSLPNSSSAKIHADMMFFSVRRGGLYVIDFIPVRIGQVGYMFDRVSGTLFGNSGTDNFIVGSDV